MTNPFVFSALFCAVYPPLPVSSELANTVRSPSRLSFPLRYALNSLSFVTCFVIRPSFLALFLTLKQLFLFFRYRVSSCPPPANDLGFEPCHSERDWSDPHIGNSCGQSQFSPPSSNVLVSPFRSSQGLHELSGSFSASFLFLPRRSRCWTHLHLTFSFFFQMPCPFLSFFSTGSGGFPT